MNREMPPVVAALCRPAVHGCDAGDIAVRETHVSWIVLTPTRVYKVKKPVQFGFLDFSTLARRRAACEAEVLVNRRFAPGVYLGVAPLAPAMTGSPWAGQGAAVEYAVVMRRLRADRMMDGVLAHGALHPRHLARLLDILFAGYARPVAPEAVRRYGDVATIRQTLTENIAELRPFVGRTLTAEDHAACAAYTDAFLTAHAPLLARRRADGWIVDGHGDVRLEHVNLGPPLVLFDAIEFDPRFRVVDVAADIAFLVMDCDRRGATDLARFVVRQAVARTGDPALEGLVHFYAVYRALVRAKVASLRAVQCADADDRQTAIKEAQGFVAWARARMDEPPRATLVALCGLMGSGKSTLAGALAAAHRLPLLVSDAIRKRLFGLHPLTAQPVPFGRGIYTAAATRRTYGAIVRAARGHLRAGRSVVVDASFSRAVEREAARRVAECAGARCLLIECRAPRRVLVARLARRTREPQAISDGRVEILHRQALAFEPVRGASRATHVIVPSTAPLADQVARCDRALLGIPHRRASRRGPGASAAYRRSGGLR